MKIAVVGSYGAGLTMWVPRVPQAGETVSGGSFNSGPGGKGSNQAIAAARLGAQVSLLTAIGADEFGKTARQLWADEGVDAKKVITGEAATMAGFIIVDAEGENRIAIAPGALDELDANAVDNFEDEIEAADIVVVSMEIPLATVMAALRVARKAGTKTLLNPAPATPLPEEAWSMIDIITPNQTEAPLILGLDQDHEFTEKQLAQKLCAKGIETVVLTRGPNGSLIATEDTLTEAPAISAKKIVDTTGAGDAFTAGLAVALAEGKSVEDALGLATAAGAHVVAIEGVIPSLPSRDQLGSVSGEIE